MGSPDRRESGSLSTFITGAVVGAGVALLFAPQAGAQLRGLLCDYAARAKDELDEAVDHGTEVLDSAVERGQEFVKQGKDSLHETGRMAKELGEAAGKAANETKDKWAAPYR
jgi:gas vesicle protein